MTQKLWDTSCSWDDVCDRRNALCVIASASGWIKSGDNNNQTIFPRVAIYSNESKTRILVAGDEQNKTRNRQWTILERGRFTNYCPRQSKKFHSEMAHEQKKSQLTESPHCQFLPSPLTRQKFQTPISFSWIVAFFNAFRCQADRIEPTCVAYSKFSAEPNKNCGTELLCHDKFRKRLAAKTTSVGNCMLYRTRQFKCQNFRYASKRESVWAALWLKIRKILALKNCYGVSRTRAVKWSSSSTETYPPSPPLAHTTHKSVCCGWRISPGRLMHLDAVVILHWSGA